MMCKPIYNQIEIQINIASVPKWHFARTVYSPVKTKAETQHPTENEVVEKFRFTTKSLTDSSSY